MLRGRRFAAGALMPVLGLVVGVPAEHGTAGAAGGVAISPNAVPASGGGGRPFQEDQRINGLTMQFGTDAFAPNNKFGGAIGTAVQGQFQSAINADVTSGQTSLVLEMLGLTDLTGTNASSLTVGVANGAPFLDPANPTTYNGNSDLDWWYTPNASELDANGVPTAQLSGSIAAKALSAGGAHMTFPLALGASKGFAAMSSVQVAATVGGSSTPLESTNNFPPGHLPSENIPPGLVSFTSMSAGHLRGNFSAASLAAIPLSAAIVQNCTAYTTSNSVLDLLVSGCVAMGFITVVTPTQPDQVDPAQPPAGAGGPYVLIANTSKTVTTCKDKNGSVVSLATCLNAAAYSAYFTFTSDRVIVPPPPRITLTPTSGPQGTALRVDGMGFVAAQTVKVKYKTGLASPPSVVLCSASVRVDGSFTCNGNVPTSLSGSVGPHAIVAKELPSAIKAKATFALTAH